MGPANAEGPAPVDLSLPRPWTPRSSPAGSRPGNGSWTSAPGRAFAAGHLPGTLNFELSTNFVTYLGWLYDWGAPLTLIGATEADVADARRELVRIGVDRLAGAATVPTDGAWPRGAAAPTRCGTSPPSPRPCRNGGAVVLDTRRDDERAAGGVRGSLHVPIHELAARLDEIPDGEVWVYCGSGYRASVAASVLARTGRRPVLVDGGYDDEGTGSRAHGLHAEQP